MSQAQQNLVGEMMIYGAGGGGINIASMCQEYTASAPGTSEVRLAYIDTSRSNIPDGARPEQCYLLENLDGSGKVRKENHEKIADEINRILLEFKPGDINIVAFTASGGTGSVAGPLLVAELLKRGKLVVTVVVGSDESAITADNTFKTLKSLDHIARSQEKPVVMFYNKNSRNMSRVEVDKRSRFTICALSFLASRQNKELDSMDVFNFLNYNRVPGSDLQPQLTLLNVFDSAAEVDRIGADTFSMAMLLKGHEEEQPEIVPVYSAAGYYRENTEAPCNLFFCLETKGLNPILSELQKTAATIVEHKQARASGPSFVSDSDHVSSTGLIL